MDDKDQEIIDLLKENSSFTSAQISKKTNIPITTVHNRIKKLEKEGIIEKFTIKLNYAKIGRPVKALILVTINYDFTAEKINQIDIANKIKKLNDVREVNIVTGSTDLVVRLQTQSIEKLNEIIVNDLRPIPGIDKTQTMIVLKEI